MKDSEFRKKFNSIYDIAVEISKVIEGKGRHDIFMALLMVIESIDRTLPQRERDHYSKVLHKFVDCFDEDSKVEMRR